MSSPTPELASPLSGTVPQPGVPALPELLAPAGDWECARAAVENGADAIYFGLERFNARMRANNFTEADLPELMAFLHQRGVKGYVTFNTLVFETEWAAAEQYARTMIAAGVDAAIVQDVGICRLLRKLSPDFPIHASTQMTITSAGGVEFARELGCNLVVLARECSLKEIKMMLADTEPQTLAGADTVAPGHRGGRPYPESGTPRTASLPPINRHPGLPLEVFVHGALCVAYSGQCLTSEALGGRSANRGECAQACRLPYELIADGKPVPLGDRKYLLSPQDLAGLELLPELARLGVASLKIEGRLKAPEYVANITRIYREALKRVANDVLGRTNGEQRGSESSLSASSVPRNNYEMEMAFSRGLYTGWFGGINNQKLVHGRFGKKRGVFLGTVAEVRRDGVALRLEGPLKAGDGIVFDAGNPEAPEQGGRVYEVRSGRRRLRKLNGLNELNGVIEGEEVLLLFGKGDVDLNQVHVGDKLWKTSDPELERQIRQSFAGNTPKFHRPINFEVHGLVGKPLTVIARDECGHVARRDSMIPLVVAENRPLTSERLREQLGRLGGTPFKLGALENCLSSQVVLPLSELNRLRRELVGDLEVQRSLPKRWTLQPEVSVVRSHTFREVEDTPAASAVSLTGTPALAGSKKGLPHERGVPTAAKLIVLVRNLGQMDAALGKGIRTLYCELEDPKKYREAVARFRSFHAANGLGTSRDASHAFEPPAIWVAPPRIFKMGEEWTLKLVRSSEADGYLVRNYDHLEYFAGQRRIGDYSLNVANRLAAEYFKEKFSLERLTASYDLNFTQLEALLRAAPPEWFEVTLHQHMPMFHMEHCVFCAFLSNGTDYTNCGRPCDHHEVRLRDRVGAEHPVKADAGCRNTVFNALAQTGAEYAGALRALGVRHFRVEFLNETPAQVALTLEKYSQLLRGEITGVEVWRELRLMNQLGVTRGQMGQGRMS